MPSTQTALKVVGGVGAYAIWYQLVVKKAARRVEEFGPRSLAIAVSKVLHDFGAWWLKFSYNEDEVIEKGIVDPKRQYMLIWHPHGVFTINSLFFFTHLSAKETIAGKALSCGVADFLFQVPGLAEFLLMCNAKHVGMDTTEKLLGAGKNVGVNPGGMHEQVNTDHTQEVVSFPGKFGFVRLAIKYGVAMVPCYNFGENQLFHTSEPLRNFNRWMYKKFQVGNLLMHGQFGIVTSPIALLSILGAPMILPDSGKELNCRMGTPVEVGPPDPNPSEEKVQEVFWRYSLALNKLFEDYKDSCLIPDVAANGLEFDVRPVAVRSKL